MVRAPCCRRLADQRLGHGGQQERHHGGRGVQKGSEGIPPQHLQLLLDGAHREEPSHTSARRLSLSPASNRKRFTRLAAEDNKA